MHDPVSWTSWKRTPRLPYWINYRVRSYYADQVGARIKNAARTDYPFHERLVRFWSNHFAVSADRQPVSALAGLFENEAIRPNLSGSVFKGVLVQHLGLQENFLGHSVFPDSKTVPVIDGLVNT